MNLPASPTRLGQITISRRSWGALSQQATGRLPDPTNDKPWPPTTKERLPQLGLPRRVIAGRRDSLDDRGGEPTLSHEIPPGRRIGPNSLSLGSAFWWEARRQSCEFAQALADVAEAQAWIEPLHQSEDVTFGVAGRIPPAASAMADDKDFAFASPVLQAESRALLPIQFPRRGGSAPAPRRNAPCRAVP